MDDNANYFHNLQVFSPASQPRGRKEEMNIHTDWKVCCKICGDYIEKINANDKV
jgi:hypothetical protein